MEEDKQHGHTSCFSTLNLNAAVRACAYLHAQSGEVPVAHFEGRHEIWLGRIHLHALVSFTPVATLTVVKDELTSSNKIGSMIIMKQEETPNVSKHLVEFTEKQFFFL